MGIFDSISDTVDDVKEEAEEAVDDVVSGAEEAASEISEGAQDVQDEVSEGDVGGAVDEATDTAGDVADTASDTAGNVASGSSDSGSSGISFGGGSSGGSSGGGGSGGSSSSGESSSSGGGSGGSSGSGSQPSMNRSPSPSSESGSSSSSGESDLEAFKKTLPGNQATNNKDVKPSELEINKADARDADIVSRNPQDGFILENPTEREFTEAYNPSQPETVQEDLNQRQRRASAENFFRGREQTERLDQRKDDLESTIDRVQSAPENAQITLTRTTENGETVTNTVSKDQALENLRSTRSELERTTRETRESTVEAGRNVFSIPRDTEENQGSLSFADLRDARPDSGQDDFSSPGFSRAPGATKKINQLQEQLRNSVMSQDQRESIQNQIENIRSRSRQSAEIAGYTNIPGQSPNSRLKVPEGAQSNVVQRGGTINEISRGVNRRVDNFLSTPEARDVQNLELQDDLATQTAAGVSTLASDRGFTYLASFVPGGRSPEDVAEEQIEDNFRNPSSGPGRTGEILLESPAGLAATAGAGAAVGGATKAASVIGASRFSNVAKGVGAGVAGIYTASQGAKVQRLASQGKTARAGGEALQTAGELGAFGKGLKAFRRFDQPQVLDTSASKANNVLRQVDNGFVGAGTLSARTNFQRGPFSRKVLGMDNTGSIETNINYRLSADEDVSEVKGILEQEIPDSTDETIRELSGLSRVIQSSEDGSRTVTRDLVRTTGEGRLFTNTEEFADTSENIRQNRERVSDLVFRNDQIVSPQTGRTFNNPNPPQRNFRTSNADASVSDFRSLSYSDETPRRQNFGESSTLIFRNGDSASGGDGSFAGSTSGGSSGKTVTVQELGGVPAGGSPVNQRGLVSQARSAARDAVAPNTQGYEVLSGGAGVGIGREAAIQDGQRASTQFQGDEIQNFQASQDFELQRSQVETQGGVDQGLQLQEAGSSQEVVTRDRTQSEEAADEKVIDLRGVEARIKAQERYDFVRPDTQETIQRPGPEYDVAPGGAEVVRDDVQGDVGRVSPSSITRVRDSSRSRFRSGEANRFDQSQGVGQRNFQTSFQGQENVQVPRLTQRSAQVPRTQLSRVQSLRTRNVQTPVNVGRGTPVRATPGLPGIDLQGELSVNPGTGEGAGSNIGRGRSDISYDLVGTFQAEDVGGEQARFQTGENFRERQLEEQRKLGAFVRNKPVQAQNISGDSSSNGGSSTRFY